MAKLVNFSSVSHKPDDLNANDGAMSLCVNLVNDDGSLRPLEKPTTFATLPAGYKVLFIHTTSTFDNYILYNASLASLYCIPSEHIGDSDYISTEGAFLIKITEEPSITALGNTLILTFKESPIRYAIFKNGKYKPLADHPPFVPMKFCTNAIYRWEEYSTKSLSVKALLGNDGSVADDSLAPFDKLSQEEAEQAITTPVLASANKFIADLANDNKFCFPFFVRYALRMYDGSLTMHSYPVLMIPNSHLIACLDSLNVTSSTISVGKGAIWAKAADLYNKFENSPNLHEWEDLIQGIDIFVSAPIYTYNQAGFVKGWGKQGSRIEQSSLQVNYDFLPGFYGEQRFSHKYHMLLPTHDDAKIREDVENCSLFYKISSIPFNEIGNNSQDNQGWNKIQLRNGVLNTITQQEVMTDDFNSHNSKIAGYSTVYNNRLNISDVTEEITGDVPITCQIPTTNIDTTSPVKTSEVFTNISIEGISHCLKQEARDSETIFANLPRYLFFPHTGVTNTIFYDTVENMYYNIPMKEHTGLNGAVYFRGFGEDMPAETTAPTNTVDSIKVNYPNKIYTSVVDNPFTFEPTMINTIGAGRIVALTSVTQAISQGQFGAFPLYAFTTEGIWALEVNSYGGWSSRSPVSRDVILNGTQPLAIDNAIVFMSEQGLMLLAGGNCRCLSSTLSSENNIPIIPDSIATPSQVESLLNFPRSASLAYDYAHARIYLFTGEGTAWIYSLRSSRWTHAILKANNVYAVNAYPECQLAISNADGTQSLLKLNADCEYHSNGFILSRPLGFDTLNLRTINNVLIKGTFSHLDSNSGKVNTILYATADGIQYGLIASSDREYIRRLSGSAYQSHRLMLITDGMTPSFSISCAVFTISEIMMNKLR